jgi:hypothetical protein
MQNVRSELSGNALKVACSASSADETSAFFQLLENAQTSISEIQVCMVKLVQVLQLLAKDESTDRGRQVADLGV